MIAGGHDVSKKRLAAGVLRIQNLRGMIKQAFVVHPPNVFRLHGFFVKIGAVDYAVIIAGKVVVHVIKHTVAAINKVGGKTALMQASYKGHLSIVCLLVERQADVNAADK